MIVTRDAEPQVNIHITGTESRSVKRRAAKQNNKGNTPKKPRVTPNNDSTQNAKRTETVAAIANDPTPDVSFRHLFSFATTSQADCQQEKDIRALGTPETFAFLHKTTDGEQRENLNVYIEPRSPDRGMDSNRTGTKEVPLMIDHRVGIQTVQRNSGSSYGREMGNQHKPYRAPGGSTGPTKFLHQTSNGREGHQVGVRSILAADALMIPDDIDSRPDQLLRIAKNFCRQKSAEQLEESWCAPGGVRETMRRDFKQKRQNVARGRKLGSSGKR